MGKYARSYIEKILSSEPTWLTCVDLYTVAPSDELGRMMGALAAAIRTGSEVTLLDWGRDWVATALENLPTMQGCIALVENKDYVLLDQWLADNEERLVRELHHSLAAHCREVTRLTAS